MKQRWVSGTRREKLTLVGVTVFALVAWMFFIVGDLAGWNDLL